VLRKVISKEREGDATSTTVVEVGSALVFSITNVKVFIERFIHHVTAESLAAYSSVL
jgi:hypothetical protein